MPHLIQTPRRLSGPLQARIAIAATLALATACDQPPDTLPTSPSRGNRTVPHATIVGANVTMLPTLGGASTTATDINDAGQVVGSSSTGGADHAFLWTPGGAMHDLGTLGGLTSHALGINTGGQVVGNADIEGSPRVWHAFVWTPGKGMRDLGTLDATYGSTSYARTIDDDGRVMGVSTSAGGVDRAFLWTPSLGMQDLGAVIGASARVIDRNTAGQVVGTAIFNGASNAFLWTPGEGTRDLGTLDGDPTVAMAINEAGWVVGYTNTGPSSRPILWTPRDGMRSLGTLGGDRNGLAVAVNDLGQIVGSSYTAALEHHAFVWTETSGMEDIFPSTGLEWVAAINNRGQVLGYDRVATLEFQTPNRAPG